MRVSVSPVITRTCQVKTDKARWEVSGEACVFWPGSPTENTGGKSLVNENRESRMKTGM